LKIRDYLGPDAQKETQLKTVAIFPRAEAMHESGCAEELSPFDKTMIERSALKIAGGPKGDMAHPVGASLCLSYNLYP
jgi:hypothetical protein